MRRRLNKVSRDSYLRVLEKTGNFALACEITGIRRTVINDEIRNNREFAFDIEQAKAVSVERMEGEAYRRAVIGVQEPIFWQGMLVDRVTKYSDSLLSKLLEAHDPKYQKKYRVTNVGNVDVPGLDLSKLSNEELDTLDRILAKTKPGDDTD
jgi:hypothetical protein